MNSPANSLTTRALGRDTSQNTPPPLPVAPASGTETATLVQGVDPCTDPGWNNDKCGRGCVGESIGSPFLCGLLPSSFPLPLV